MIYTQGVRKIFNTNMMSAGIMIEDAFHIAKQAGYEALNFNGLIYVYNTVTKEWTTTCFTLDDFEAK